MALDPGVRSIRHPNLVWPGTGLNIDTPKSVEKTRPLQLRRPLQVPHCQPGHNDEIVPSSDPEERLQESIDAFVSF